MCTTNFLGFISLIPRVFRLSNREEGAFFHIKTPIYLGSKVVLQVSHVTKKKKYMSKESKKAKK